MAAHLEHNVPMLWYYVIGEPKSHGDGVKCHNDVIKSIYLSESKIVGPPDFQSQN